MAKWKGDVPGIFRIRVSFVKAGYEMFLKRGGFVKGAVYPCFPGHIRKATSQTPP